MLILFLLAVYGVPLLLGLVALLVGTSVRATSRAALGVVLPLAVLAGLFWHVFDADGWTGYSRYLRTCTVLAALGLLAAVTRDVVARRRKVTG